MTALFAELLTIVVVVTAVCWIVALERRAVVDEARDAADKVKAAAWLASLRDTRGTTWPAARCVEA